MRGQLQGACTFHDGGGGFVPPSCLCLTSWGVEACRELVGVAPRWGTSLAASFVRVRGSCWVCEVFVAARMLLRHPPSFPSSPGVGRHKYMGTVTMACMTLCPKDATQSEAEINEVGPLNCNE